MRAVIQRVSSASVEVEGKIVGKINAGLLVLLGIEDADCINDIEWLSKKIVQLRIFNDTQNVMNKSIVEVAHTDKKGYKITLKALEKLIEQSITLGKNPIIIIANNTPTRSLTLILKHV